MDRLARAPRWPFHAVLGGGLLCLMWAASPPGGNYALVLYALAAVGLCGAAWVGRLLLAMRARRVSWSFALTPALVAVTTGLIAMDVPFQLRWALSRPAFVRVVADWERRPGADPRAVVPNRVGTYRVPQAFAVPGGYVFREASGGFLDDVGFAYLPQGPRASSAPAGWESSPVYRHLGGPWYTWRASW